MERIGDRWSAVLGGFRDLRILRRALRVLEFWVSDETEKELGQWEVGGLNETLVVANVLV